MTDLLQPHFPFEILQSFFCYGELRFVFGCVDGFKVKLF